MRVVSKIRSHPLLGRVAGGAIWSLTGSVFNRLTPLIISLVVARLLGKEVFGEYSVVRGTISMLSVFAGIGVGVAATREAAKYAIDGVKLSETVSTVITLAAIFGLIGSSIVWLISDWIAVYFFLTIDLAQDFRTCSLLLFFSVLVGAVQGLMNGLEAYKNAAIINLILLCAIIPMAIWLMLNYSLKGALIGMVIHAALSALSLMLSLKYQVAKGVQLFSDFTIQRSRELIVLAAPLVLIQLVPAPAFWYAKTLLVSSAGSFEQIAVFDAGYQWLTIIMMITGSVSIVALPIFASSKDSSNYQNLFKVNAYISLLLIIVFALFSPAICWLYGDDFVGDWYLFCLIFSSALPFTLSAISRNWLIARNRQNIVFCIVLAQNALMVTLCCLVDEVSAVSLALINLFCWFLGMFVMMWSCRDFNVRVQS